MVQSLKRKVLGLFAQEKSEGVKSPKELEAETIDKINKLISQVGKKRELLRDEIDKVTDSQRHLRALLRLIRNDNFTAALAGVDNIQNNIVSREELEEQEIAEIDIIQNRALLEIEGLLKALSGSK